MRNGSLTRLWQRVFRLDPADEVDAELSHHLEQRISEYVAQGMTPDEARHAALERLGDLDRVRAECTDLLTTERRADERRVRLVVSWLDIKLGLRMLAKYPGLSVVSVIGMAVAIAIGAGSFAVIDSILDPTLPLESGDRIVSLQNNRLDESGNPERRVLHDFVIWREELQSVRDLGAFRTDRRNLVAFDSTTALVRVAEMSAAGFRVAGVSPLLGRTLLDEDERPGAPAVVVIGHEEWQGRFEGDPGIIGRRVRLGAAEYSVVGVMPAGFRFPLGQRYWVPLRLNPSDYAFGTGPAIELFGRLADGVTLRQAQAELTLIGQRMSVDHPETHRLLRPRVLRYTDPFFDVDSPAIRAGLWGVQLGISMLLVVIAVNVAVLVYARTATRAGEIAVRRALGASRGRVVIQMFVEGFVLSALAAIAGLAIAAVAVGRLQAMLVAQYGDELPFWLDFGLSARSIVYVAGLAVVAGAIVGVLPALKATGRRVQSELQQLSARGSGMQLGRMWTVLIVSQVGMAVAALPAALFWPGAMATFGAGDPGYAIDEFVRARLSMERVEAPPTAESEAYERAFQTRFANRAADLQLRLEAEPGVEVTFAASFPGTGEPPARIEIEGLTRRADAIESTGNATFGVLVNQVGIGLFDMFDAPILAGRGFVEADSREGALSVIVDQTFVDRVADGANVIGRRFRYLGVGGSAGAARGPSPASRAGRIDVPVGAAEPQPGPWHEIVGVVPALTAPMLPTMFNEVEPRIYHAAAPARVQTTMLITRLRGRDASSFVAPLRDITGQFDPALQLHELMTAADARRDAQRGLSSLALGIVIVTASVLLLSAAGIYAMMSFTVARRRREIGIRSALGATPQRVMRGVFARAFAQLAAGVVVGLLLATALELMSHGMIMGGHARFVLPAVAAIIVGVGLLAALVPARRGLAVQPTEALRAE